MSFFKKNSVSRAVDPGVAWQQDHETKACRCGQKIGVGSRHHCRICGILFCDKCCPEAPTGAARRVCLGCGIYPRWLRPVECTSLNAIKQELASQRRRRTLIKELHESFGAAPGAAGAGGATTTAGSPTSAPPTSQGRAAPAAAAAGETLPPPIKEEWAGRFATISLEKLFRARVDALMHPDGTLTTSDDTVVRRTSSLLTQQARFYLMTASKQLAGRIFIPDNGIAYVSDASVIFPRFHKGLTCVGRGSFGKVYKLRDPYRLPPLSMMTSGLERGDPTAAAPADAPSAAAAAAAAPGPVPEYQDRGFIAIKQIAKLLTKQPSSRAANTIDQSIFQPEASAPTARVRKFERLEVGWTKTLEEIGLMRQVALPNVSPIIDVFQTSENLFVTSRFGDGGTLATVESMLSSRAVHFDREAFAAHAVAQVARGLRDMYQKYGLVHRDIKQDNIVFSRDFAHVMIIDFGFTTKLVDRDQFPVRPMSFPGPAAGQTRVHMLSEVDEGEQKVRLALCGTPGFAPPEVIDEVCKRKSTTCCTPFALHQGDVYSLGVVLFCLLGGCTFDNAYPKCYVASPEGHRFSFFQMQRLMQGGIPISGAAWRTVSDEARHLLQSMLRYSYRDRITCDEILTHPFIVKKGKVFTESFVVPYRKQLAAEDVEIDKEFILSMSGAEASTQGLAARRQEEEEMQMNQRGATNEIFLDSETDIAPPPGDGFPAAAAPPAAVEAGQPQPPS